MVVTARRSLQSLRRALANHPALNSLTLVTTDTVTQAADASTVRSPDLQGGLDPNLYRQDWVMPASGLNAGLIRRPGTNSLDPTQGTLNVTVAWPNIMEKGAVVEIHDLLPPVGRDKMTGLKDCINMALSECWFPQRLPIVGVAGQPTYDISSYSDWLSPQLVEEVYGPAADPTLLPPAWTGFNARWNAEVLDLDVAPAFNTGDAINVEVMRPANTYIKVGGAWTTSTVGLQNDDDECLLQPELIVEVALAHAFSALAQGTAEARGYWGNQAQAQRRKANLLKRMNLPHPTHRLQHGGGARVSARDFKDFMSW